MNFHYFTEYSTDTTMVFIQGACHTPNKTQSTKNPVKSLKIFTILKIPKISSTKNNKNAVKIMS